MMRTYFLLLGVPTLIGATGGADLRYDCTLERMVILSSEGAEWSGDGPMPADEANRWKFSVEVSGAATHAVVKFDPDMMQIAGRHELTWLAPGQFAFSPRHSGPCLFTEKGCMALIEISDVDEKSAVVSVTPAGSALHQESGRRNVFQPISLGRCRRSKESGS